MQLVCLIISFAVIIISALLAFSTSAGKYKRGRIFTPLNIVLTGAILAVFIGLIPIYIQTVDNTKYHFLETLLFSALNTLQVFTINTNGDIILDNINESATLLSQLYSVYLSVLFVFAPFLTFGFLASFFKNFTAYIKYLTRFFKDVYVFSELNERSLALGADIKRNHKDALIVYTDVFDNNTENFYELYERAMELKAICFKKDLLAINFKLHYNKSNITFFTIGADEVENMEQSLRLISLYNSKKNARLFVFSTSIESELLLTNAEKGYMTVRRVNEVRSLILRILYEDGYTLFENAADASESEKMISAVIVGMGKHGTEMLKALSWYCQMDGYTVRINAFDKDEKALDKFSARCPELVPGELNGAETTDEYNINIHSGIDVETKTFADEIGKLASVTYVLVALGSDEANIKTAVNLRTLFERSGSKPIIQAIVHNSDENKALQGIKNFKGQPYNIDFVGSIESSCSEKVIINSELEEEALQRHLKYGTADDFWKYEYNYRSSIASALHMKARIYCKIPGADKAEEDLTVDERDIIERLEHRRWNAYMRSEGYIYSGSPEKSSRNDLGKMHHDLVDFSRLSEEEKRKDSRVGTK